MQEPSKTVLRLTALPARRPTEFTLEPDQAARRKLARELELTELSKLRFSGTLRPVGRNDWQLDGTLGATVEQPCGVTLAPVRTRIDETVRRRYSDSYTAPDETEAEVPEDDTLEPLPETVDLNAVMAEALTLAVPAFPRAPGAELGAQVFAPEGVEPLTEEKVKPFAALADLKKRLGGGDDTGNGGAA
ncbi:hypothetical protein ATO2_00515 [Roseovarius sp. 22II1-1F6A]|nr:hypothetical protein ATO2_00515 [Roseovarius sp. 22II1-1F6A]